MLRFHIPSTELHLSSQFIRGYVCAFRAQYSRTRVHTKAHTYLCGSVKIWMRHTDACTDVLYFIISPSHGIQQNFHVFQETGLCRQPYIFPRCFSRGYVPATVPRRRRRETEILSRSFRDTNLLEFVPIAGA